MKRPSPRPWPARLLQLYLSFLLFSLLLPRLPAQEMLPVLVTNAPPVGTFYWLSGFPPVPYPFDPAHGLLPVWSFDGAYYVDDSELLQNLEGGNLMAMRDELLPWPGDTVDTGGDTNFTCNTLTNFTVNYLYSANGLTLGIAPTTNSSMALTIQTTTNATYDVFGTTNMADLALPALGRTNWAWLTRARGDTTNLSWGQTNWCERYFQLGSMADFDNDGLTDAYEELVSQTATNAPNSPRAIFEAVISNQIPSAWFKLNESSLADAQGGSSLTNGGGFWDVDGFASGSNAFAFNVNTQRLVMGDVISGGSGTNQGSLSLLFRSLTGYPTSTPRYVFCQKGNTTNEFSMFFEGTNSPAGAFKVQIAGQTNVLLLSNAVVFGTWYYLAMTWNESNHLATWYLAPLGGTLSSGTIDLGTTNVVGNSTNVNFGNRDGQSRAISSPGNGALDEIAFWNRELTPSEVNAQFDTLKVLFQGPSKAFDLTRWELTLPVDATNQLDNSHKPLDIGTAWLNSGFKYVDPTDFTQKYFYLSNGSQMVFEAPWNGADQDSASPPTNGSPRSELRETLANGSEFNWKPYNPATGTATNTHTLQATCTLESIPSKVIFGQIHTETPEPPSGGLAAITLFHEGAGTANKRIRLAVYYSPDKSVTNDGDTDLTYDLVSGVNVGDRIDYELKMVGTSNNVVTLKATVSTNGITLPPRDVNMISDFGYSGWAATNVTLYFKAGCYYPKAATNSATAKVTFSNLEVTHQP
jgi:hypothetical protein